MAYYIALALLGIVILVGAAFLTVVVIVFFLPDWINEDEESDTNETGVTGK